MIINPCSFISKFYFSHVWHNKEYGCGTYFRLSAPVSIRGVTNKTCTIINNRIVTRFSYTMRMQNVLGSKQRGLLHTPALQSTQSEVLILQSAVSVPHHVTLPFPRCPLTACAQALGGPKRQGENIVRNCSCHSKPWLRQAHYFVGSNKSFTSPFNVTKRENSIVKPTYWKK